jgi:hypothetical protein
MVPRILTRKHVQRLRERSRKKWEDKLKVDLTEMDCEDGSFLKLVSFNISGIQTLGSVTESTGL